MLPRFAVCMPYRNAPQMLRAHYDHWNLIGAHLIDFQMSVVDDCSDKLMPAPDMRIAAYLREAVQGWRILGEHIPWSHRCATNWAVEKSRAPWLVITDIDHMLPLSTVVDLQNRYSNLNPDAVYTFERRNTDGSEKTSHPDSWLMSRSMWQRIGGYDERLRGHYGQNWDFIQRVKKHAMYVERLPSHLVRYARTDIPDASMPDDYPRKSLVARAAVARLRNEHEAAGTYFDRHALTTFVKRVF